MLIDFRRPPYDVRDYGEARAPAEPAAADTTFRTLDPERSWLCLRYPLGWGGAPPPRHGRRAPLSMPGSPSAGGLKEVPGEELLVGAITQPPVLALLGPG